MQISVAVCKCRPPGRYIATTQPRSTSDVVLIEVDGVHGGDKPGGVRADRRTAKKRSIIRVDAVLAQPKKTR